MKNVIIAFCTAIVVISCVSLSSKKETTTSKMIPIDGNVVKGKLQNGMTYYIRKNSKPEQKVELRLVVKAGSVLETEKQLGLAHFMEHMNFNGSKNFKKNELVDYLQSIGVKFGAHLNAYTSFDETVYILPIPSEDDEKLEKGFLILEDWAFNASLTSEEIDKERGVVLEEYRLGLGADKRMMANYLPKLMFKSRYAERLPIGTKEVLENFTHDDLRNFYKDWYRPDLMAIVAVGDVDVAVLEEKIIAHFGKYATVKNPKKRTEYSLLNHKETLVSIESDSEADQSVVQLYYKDLKNATPLKTEADYREKMVNRLFVHMINKRLDELRNLEKPPFVFGYSTYSGTWAKSKSAYQSAALTSENGQLEALKTLLIENERVLKHGFQQSELDRAKLYLLNSTERFFNEREKLESSSFVGEYVRNFLKDEAFPGIVWEYETLQKILPNITLEDCNALISGYIHPENRVVIITGPEKKDVPKIKESEVLQLFKEVESVTILPFEESAVGKELMKTIPKAGEIAAIKKDSILDVTHLTLANGLKITYKKTDFQSDKIVFTAYSLGGTSLYSDDEYKKTDIATSALTEAGVNGFSKIELSKILSGKMVSVNPFIGDLSEGFNGACIPKDLETLFQLTHLYFTKLNNDPKAYASYKAKMQAYLQNALSSPSTYYSVTLNKFLNSNNPRYMGFPTDEHWENTDYDLAHKKYQERFADASDFHFYFVGNIDENELIKHAKTYLGSLPTTYSKENFKDVEGKPLTGILEKIIKKGSEPKSKVQIMYQGTASYDANEAYYLKCLGEILTIKLIEQLREEESGVYGAGAHGSMNKNPHATYDFSISFPCGPENVQKLIDKTLEEVEKIKKNGVSEKDLNKIKEAQLLDYKVQLKDNGYWLSLLKNADFNEFDPAEVFQKEARIKELTSEDVQKVAKKYLVKNRIIGILNPEE